MLRAGFPALGVSAKPSTPRVGSRTGGSIQRGSPPSTPGWHQPPTGGEEKGIGGQAGGTSSPGGRRATRGLRVEDGGRPGRRRPSEWRTGPSCRRDLASLTPRVREWMCVPRCPGVREQRRRRGGLSARAPRSPVADRPVQASRRARHLRPPLCQPICARESEASPGHPAGHASPRPQPGSPGPTAPLTTETWRPGPGRRRSRARGSQLWAPRLGDGGRGPGPGWAPGRGRAGAGMGGGRDAPPPRLSSSPRPEEGPGG